MPSTDGQRFSLPIVKIDVCVCVFFVLSLLHGTAHNQTFCLRAIKTDCLCAERVNESKLPAEIVLQMSWKENQWYINRIKCFHLPFSGATGIRLISTVI